MKDQSGIELEVSQAKEECEIRFQQERQELAARLEGSEQAVRTLNEELERRAASQAELQTELESRTAHALQNTALLQEQLEQVEADHKAAIQKLEEETVSRRMPFRVERPLIVLWCTSE